MQVIALTPMEYMTGNVWQCHGRWSPSVERLSWSRCVLPARWGISWYVRGLECRSVKHTHTHTHIVSAVSTLSTGNNHNTMMPNMFVKETCSHLIMYDNYPITHAVSDINTNDCTKQRNKIIYTRCLKTICHSLSQTYEPSADVYSASNVSGIKKSWKSRCG